MSESSVRVIDLGQIGYAEAYAEQCRRLDEVLAARAVAEETLPIETSPPRKRGRMPGEANAAPELLGYLLLLEHPPVITVSNRPTARQNLIADAATLAAAGVEVAPTDRGGDITYHGPGQLVAYPILDLLRLRLNLHGYMRLLEEAAIRVCARFDVEAQREKGLTGVWVKGAKICAFGVRVRKWISMHGLALNVTTDLRHFELIVPCGLARPVTSLERELGARCPSMAAVKRAMGKELSALTARAPESERQGRSKNQVAPTMPA